MYPWSGVYVPCIYLCARWELRQATQVFAVVLVWCHSSTNQLLCVLLSFLCFVYWWIIKIYLIWCDLIWFEEMVLEKKKRKKSALKKTDSVVGRKNGWSDSQTKGRDREKSESPRFLFTLLEWVFSCCVNSGSAVIPLCLHFWSGHSVTALIQAVLSSLCAVSLTMNDKVTRKMDKVTGKMRIYGCPIWKVVLCL